MNEYITSLIVATILLLGSPGPAPLALAGVGATYGVKRGVPFLLGILFGLIIVIFGAAVGLAAVFSTFPGLKLLVQILGAIYIVYVAQKIARAPILKAEGQSLGSIPKFTDGFILNLLNPKAYAAFFALFSQFLLPLDGRVISFVATAAVCFLIAVVVDFAWLLLGHIIRPLFETPKSARIMRVSFAVLMVAAVVWALLQ